mmetsp:Transcript_14607/g.49467  ORF Transcript_14607/g.49467 Transcript_14607/m.49467 type:complete len:145 (-) Transcript_14607:180-614(-)
MATCCSRSSGMVPDLATQLREGLSRVRNVFPYTRYVCVLSGQGELMSSQLAPEEMPGMDLLAAIASLKRAALAFSSTLNQSECSVIHLAGDAHVFSCYEVGDHLLAFFSEVDMHTFNTLDVDMYDQQVLEIIADMRLLLQNVAA